MHLRSHYGTNKDKCFSKHSIDMTFYILIQFLWKEEKISEDTALPGWLIASCHVSFHLGSHRLRLSIGLTEMKTVKMTWTLRPTTVRKAETSSCESTQSFGKTRCLPRFLWHTCGFESSAVVQHLKVSWHILLCLHATHPNQGTWGSHSRVSSLFSEVTQTRGQCTQGDSRGRLGLGLGLEGWLVGGLPKKFKHHTNICRDTVMAAGMHVFFFTSSPSFSASQQLHLCQSLVWSSSADARVASVHVISAQKAAKTMSKTNNWIFEVV